MDGLLSLVLHGSGLGTCVGATDGNDTRARQAHREFGAPHHRARGRFQLHLLSSGPEPRTLEQACYSKPTSGVDHRPSRPERTRSDRHRRHHRASVGPEDCCPRHLPRSGPIEPYAFRQDQWPALVELHGAVPAAKGKPLPKLKTIAEDETTVWRRTIASEWYGDDRCELDLASGTALWYRPGSQIVPLRWVLVRDPSGARPIQAFFSTDTNLSPEEILAFFVRRWQVEGTFAEVRAHLGVETQRQWSDLAILRTTPALLGLYSPITLWAAELLDKGATPYAAAWYRKSRFTFSDAIAAVRLNTWVGDISSRSTVSIDQQKIPPNRLIRIAQTICHAA